MRIGVVSDTHNHLPNVARIVELLNEAGVGCVIHTGDITQAKTLEVLSRLDAPLVGVYGNNDAGERAALEAAAGRFSMRLCDPPFELQLAERRILVVTITTTWCHWCHVMAHESFEDPETAAFMNEHFINIKVDREERPDLDSIYMSAVVAMTGQGGWPMTVALTPEGDPFFGGTVLGISNSPLNLFQAGTCTMTSRRPRYSPRRTSSRSAMIQSAME